MGYFFHRMLNLEVQRYHAPPAPKLFDLNVSPGPPDDVAWDEET